MSSSSRGNSLLYLSSVHSVLTLHGTTFGLMPLKITHVLVISRYKSCTRTGIFRLLTSSAPCLGYMKQKQHPDNSAMSLSLGPEFPSLSAFFSPPPASSYVYFIYNVWGFTLYSMGRIEKYINFILVGVFVELFFNLKILKCGKNTI